MTRIQSTLATMTAALLASSSSSSSIGISTVSASPTIRGVAPSAESKFKSTAANRLARPAIQDAHQADKIQSWRRLQQQQRQRRMQQQQQHQKQQQQQQSEYDDQQQQQQHHRELPSAAYSLHTKSRDAAPAAYSLHSKSKDWGTVTVSHGEDVVHAQEVATTTATATASPGIVMNTVELDDTDADGGGMSSANSFASSSSGSSGSSSSSINAITPPSWYQPPPSFYPPNNDGEALPYYPLWTTPSLTSGTCSNNGLQPDYYTYNGFLFDGSEGEMGHFQCCIEWFLDWEGCLKGLAGVTVDGVLLRRDVSTGQVIDTSTTSVITTTTEEGELEAQSASGNNNNNSSGNNKFYPSFDIINYPNGACLNDGNEPGEYALNADTFLFEDEVSCCQEWFIDLDKCLAGSGGSASSPTQYPTWNLDNDGTTPWPTWSDDIFNDDDDGDVDGGDEDDYAPSINIHDNGSDLDAQEMQESSSSSTSSSNNNNNNIHYIYYESFEQGSFLPSQGWSTVSSNNDDATELWEADRTATAYHGEYAARPGILSQDSSFSNLTLTLSDIDMMMEKGITSFQGGLLTFSIHAAVQLPIDGIYFTVNHRDTIRTFDHVTGDAGDWEEVSILLLPGEDVLTWSYQLHGLDLITDPEEIDERRVGNSWIDAVAIQPFTGTYHFQDVDRSNKLNLGGGSGSSDASWSLVQDSHAFSGSKSYIAYTQDIESNSGSATLSWDNVIVGPNGGVISFAAFASIYAPHDVLEFSVDGVPEVAITIPSYSWEEKYVALGPGKHSLQWKLVKNRPGLGEEILDGVDLPEGYQGYVKVDGIVYSDNSGDVDVDDVDTTTSSTSTTTTTSSTVLSSTTSSSSSTDWPETTSTGFSETTSTNFPETTSTDFPETISTSTLIETTSTVVTTTEEPETSTVVTTTEATSSTATTSSDSTTESATSEPTTETPVTVSAQVSLGSTASPEDLQDNSDQDDQGEDTNCPDGLQPVDGLVGCCVPEPNFLGDGACDPWEPYNTAECGYDLGDCCRESCDEDSPYGCFTKEGGEYGPFGFFCLDPRFSTIDESACQIENREWIGDGGCDADGGYNTPECGFDGGDCCEETCDTDYSFYTCGANQPYACVDPNVGKARSATLPDFHEGFESGNFDHSYWSYLDTGDAKWEVDDDTDGPAAEGTHYAEAHTEDIIADFGEAVLEFRVASPNGGKLSFQVQTFNRAPLEDLVLKIDTREVSVIVDTMSEWRLEEFDIPAGEHTISWVHRKNPGNLLAEELDMVESSLGISRIDDVTFHPN